MPRFLVVDDSAAMRTFVRSVLESFEADVGSGHGRADVGSGHGGADVGSGHGGADVGSGHGGADVGSGHGGADVEVVEAASGFDALRLLPRGRYDLVITDINMPDINGLELIRFVRQSEHHKNTALVIISTQSSERDRDRGMKLGANAFLSKPFTPEALREAVAQSLAASRR